jgi:hypothetical protein
MQLPRERTSNTARRTGGDDDDDDDDDDDVLAVARDSDEIAEPTDERHLQHSRLCCVKMRQGLPSSSPDVPALGQIITILLEKRLFRSLTVYPHINSAFHKYKDGLPVLTNSALHRCSASISDKKSIHALRPLLRGFRAWAVLSGIACQGNMGYMGNWSRVDGAVPARRGFQGWEKRQFLACENGLGCDRNHQSDINIQPCTTGTLVKEQCLSHMQAVVIDTNHYLAFTGANVINKYLHC